MPPSSFKTAFLPVPIKAVTDAFTGMPKKSAPHIDGWTWELFRDMANRPRTADLLRTFVELFANGKLPKALWKFLSTAIMIPFHKLAQAERDFVKDPRLRFITIGALLCRFSKLTYRKPYRTTLKNTASAAPRLEAGPQESMLRRDDR